MTISRVLVWLAAAGAATYVALACLVRVGYRGVLYPAPPPAASPREPAGMTLLTLTAEDGVPVHALYRPAPPGARTVVYFHGNAETAEDGAELAARMVAAGLGVVLVEYRGYGVSRGNAGPTEAGLYRDARAVLDALEQRGTRAADVVLWGRSLGSGVAVEMARSRRGHILVLVSPYTSIPALAGRILPIFPMRLVLGDHFDTASKTAAIAMPTLVVHGDADEVIPFSMGEQVARAVPGARLIRIEGGHHNDLFGEDGAVLDAITRAVAKIP